MGDAHEFATLMEKDKESLAFLVLGHERRIAALAAGWESETINELLYGCAFAFYGSGQISRHEIPDKIEELRQSLQAALIDDCRRARREGARKALKDAEAVVANETEQFGSVVQRAAVHAVKMLRRALGEEMDRG